MRRFVNMFRNATFVIVAFLSATATAQTTTNVQRYWKGNTIASVIGNANTDMNQFYLYNVGTHKYITASSFWGTSIALYEVGIRMTAAKSGNYYTLYSNAIQTTEGSYLSWVKNTTSSYPNIDNNRVYCDRSNTASNTNVPYWTFTPVPGTPTGTTAYYINCYTGYSGTTASTPQYLVADPTNALSTETTFEIKYNTTQPTVTSVGDSTGIWKIVTLKDLKDDFKSRYATNENPSEATFFFLNQNFMRSTLAKTQNYWKPSTGLTYSIGVEGSINGTVTNSDSARFNGKYYYADVRGPQNGTITQTAAVNRPGWYKVTCSGFYRKGSGSTISAKLFAHDLTNPDDERSNPYQMLYELDDPGIDTRREAGQSFYEGRYVRNSVFVFLPGDETDSNFSRTMSFGIEISGSTSANDWVAFDDFQMKYCGTGTLYLDEDETSLGYLNAQIANYAMTMVLQRSLIKDQWNSIMLPVSLNGSQFESAFGSTAKLSKLKGQDGTVRTQIDFESVQIGEANRDNIVMEANKLYIIKPTRELRQTAAGGFDAIIGTTSGVNDTVHIEGTYFTAENVSLTSTISTSTVQQTTPAAINNDNLTYWGTLINSGTNTLVPINSYILNVDGKWYHTSKAYPVKGFRCWIEAKDPSATAAKELTFTIDGVEEGTTTAIMGLNADATPIPSDMIYNINGQFIGKGKDILQSLPKGIYIVGGKKYIIK